VSVLLRRRTKRYDRVAAALNLFDSVVPGAASACARLALRNERLPLRCDAVTPLAFGAGDTVFQLRGDGEPVACKVERRSLGRPTSDLFALARWRADAFQQILQDYAEVRDVFPSARFLVAHGPMFGVRAVVTIQTFVAGPWRDILRDVDTEEIRGLVAHRPRLRAQITGFLRRTIAAWERGEWIVDLGSDNLVLAGEGDTARLVYLDVEMKEVRSLRGSVRETMYETLVERMRAVLNSLAAPPGYEPLTIPAPTS